MFDFVALNFTVWSHTLSTIGDAPRHLKKTHYTILSSSLLGRFLIFSWVIFFFFFLCQNGMIKRGEVSFHVNLSFFIYWTTTRVWLIQYLCHVIKVCIKECLFVCLCCFVCHIQISQILVGVSLKIYRMCPSGNCGYSLIYLSGFLCNFDGQNMWLLCHLLIPFLVFLAKMDISK